MEMIDVLPLAFVAFAVGGAVKRMIGVGLPLTTVSLLSAFVDVPTAVALNSLPPLIIDATALRLDKDAFVAALGTFFPMGGIFVTLAFVERGVLDAATAPWSLACVPPVLAGMWLGRRRSRRIDQQRFRSIVLVVPFVLGFNLLRRALF